MGCNACNSVYRVPLLSLLEALLKWLQKGGKGCGMWNQRLSIPEILTTLNISKATLYRWLVLTRGNRAAPSPRPGR